MRTIVVLALTGFLAACESPVAEMAATSGLEGITPELEISPDWVPEPPFGWSVYSYEFFPDSVESTFDSISAAFDTVTWRREDFLRFTAYGEGWEVPVFTNGSWAEVTLGTIRPRITKYMKKIGRLGAGILSQTPEEGIALLDRIPGESRCSSVLGATASTYDTENGIQPLLVVLLYEPFEGLLSFSRCERTDQSVTGVMLHEFGHVLVDPILECSRRWRDAVIGDSELFPSHYARYHAKGYHPERTRSDYYECHDEPPLYAAEGDTIPNGEDLPESFAMWWLTRCKTGEEPVMDAVVRSSFPHRLEALDRALDPLMTTADSTYVSKCQFPIIAADRHQVLLDRLFKRDTIPDGIIVR